jgi:hypothetical protein
MKLSVYQATGFYCLNNVAPEGLIKIPAAAVAIVQGDYLTDDTNGYATNTATDTSAIVHGIAAEDCDNSAGAAGAKSVLVIPITSNERFSVPVGNAALIARTNVGTPCDLHTNNTLDIADVTIATGTFALWVEDFDASTEAVDGNTFGYAIGRFRVNAP